MLLLAYANIYRSRDKRDLRGREPEEADAKPDDDRTKRVDRD